MKEEDTPKGEAQKKVDRYLFGLRTELRVIEAHLYYIDGNWWRKLVNLFKKNRLIKRREDIRDFLLQFRLGNKKIAVMRTEPKVQFCDENEIQTENMEFDYFKYPQA